MPMLGDILAQARDAAGPFQAWLESSDPEMAASVAVTAANLGLGPAAFVRMAVADFARGASEEDWATLVSSLRDSADPGETCLHAMVHWRLSATGCGRHAPGPNLHGQGAAHE